MKTNATGVALIKQFEQCRLTAYRCPAGIWTIGYGHTGPKVYEGLKISQVRADTWLTDDLARFETAVARCLKTETTANQFAAMVALCFNIGEGNFAKSSVLKHHNANNQAKAAECFLLWNKATNAEGQKVELRGLTRRRAAEAALYLTPTAEEEGVDPQRTRSSDVEPSEAPSAPAIPTWVKATAAAAPPTMMVAKEAVVQVNGVWSWLQEAGIDPHIASAVMAAAVIAIGGWTVWVLLKHRPARG